MHQMPVAAESVFARVLAHGRDEYPVGKTDPGQLDGGKQQRSICGQNGLAQNKAKLTLLLSRCTGQAKVAVSRARWRPKAFFGEHVRADTRTFTEGKKH